MRKTLFPAVLAILISGAVANASTLFLVTTRTGNDVADWSQLGPDNATITNPFNATSTGGIGITGPFAGAGSSFLSYEGTSWFGNFTPGDALVWTNSPGQGPLTLTFSSAVSQAGAQIQTDYFGPFTARIDAYSGNTLLDSFTEFDNATSLEDGSAIYIGIQDGAGATITRVVFSLTSAAGDPADFAINQLSLTTAAVPEPGTLALAGCGLLVAGIARWRFSKGGKILAVSTRISPGWRPM